MFQRLTVILVSRASRLRLSGTKRRHANRTGLELGRTTGIRMTNKQAYLDALNSGRRRRPSTSIDELNRTLAELETRISERSTAETSNPRSLTSEIETQRRNEDSIDAAGTIASELKLLRDDLNDKITAGIEREFAALEQELEGARAIPASCRADELSGEVERLAAMISALAARGAEDNASRLQAEMETVKQMLADVARQSTLESVEERWGALDRRFEEFAGTESGPIKTIQGRLEDLGAVIATLPEPATMHALDDKLKVLAAAMDRFAQKQGPLGDSALSLIDERLDEISRAIAASASAGRGLIVDGKPFDRIEARIGSLAKQIDELIEDRPAADIGPQVAAMSARIDEIASHAAMPHETITKLAEQMTLIASKVDAMPPSPDLSKILKGVERRIATVSQTIEDRNEASSARSRQLFVELDQRLTALTERLQAVQAEQSPTALMAAMDERFAAFTDSFEGRLDSISKRLETTTATLAAIDPDLVRSLELQVKNLSETIQAPAQLPVQFENLAPRLERLEEVIASNHAAILDAARQAADEAVRAVSGVPNRDNNVVQGLADDLRALEALARRSDERNTKTFEAIHDTLLKIVERLGTMEQEDDQDDDQVRVGIAGAPALDPEVEDMSIEPPRGDEVSKAPPLAEDRAASFDTQDADAQPRSMIARVLKRKQKQPPQALESIENPDLDDNAPIDPAIVNQPIEPGRGSPDLNAIMRRVRDERSGQQTSDIPEADSAKADFIAAARRAAQAAAAEAATLKSSKSAEGTSRFSLSKLLRSKNRAITMGLVAVTLALAGLQIGKTVTAGGETVAAIEPATGPEAQTNLLTSAKADAIAEPVLATLPGPVAETAVEVGAIETASITAPEPLVDTSASAAAVEAEPVEAADAVSVPPEAGNAALRAAAEAGDPRAFFEIAARYAEGRGVESDLATAAAWYERAADAQLAPAQYRLANMFEKGTGVDRNFGRAIELYKIAADRGNASAMHNLAVLYAMGAEGPADNGAAARYFGKAAELGVRDSQFNLGILAAKGVGMPQDLTEAYKWFAIVAKAGDADAATKRDEVAKLLQADDLARAKSKADLWSSKPLDDEINAVVIPAEWTEDMEHTAGIDIGEAIRQVQALLNAKGYDAGRPDGVIGMRTSSAIAAFQKDHEMEPTGEIDEPLVRALLATT